MIKKINCSFVDKNRLSLPFQRHIQTPCNYPSIHPGKWPWHSAINSFLITQLRMGCLILRHQKFSISWKKHESDVLHLKPCEMQTWRVLIRCHMNYRLKVIINVTVFPMSECGFRVKREKFNACLPKWRHYLFYNDMVLFRNSSMIMITFRSIQPDYPSWS